MTDKPVPEIWTPTKEELEALGMTNDELPGWIVSETYILRIPFKNYEGGFPVLFWFPKEKVFTIGSWQVYPKSLSELKTLLSMLTP